MDPNDTIDLNQFSEQDRLDLQRALNHEMQKSKIQECKLLSPPLPTSPLPSPLPPLPLPSLPSTVLILSNDPRFFPTNYSNVARFFPPTKNYSSALAHGPVLDQVRDGQDRVGRPGPRGGGLCPELCREVPGGEYEDYKAFGGDEGEGVSAGMLWEKGVGEGKREKGECVLCGRGWGMGRLL